MTTVLCSAAWVTMSSPAGATSWRAPTPAASVSAVSAPAAAGAAVHHARECSSVRAAGATIVVPVVIDTGGASDHAQVSCVSVAAGSNDAQVLAARAKLLGVPAPRYAISGLLCAIDRYPASGCGQQNGTHYAYWAYFHGGVSWTYASSGPASWTVTPGDVEGWRFEPDGSGTPADPPPRSPSDGPTLCPASGPPTTTTTTPSTTPPSTPPPPTAAPGTSASAGGGGPAPASSSPSSSSATPFVAGRGTGGPKTAPGASTAPRPSTATSPPPSSGGDGGQTGARHRTATRLASARDPAAHGHVPVGVIVAVALIAALAAGAVIRTRRSSKAG